MLFIRIPQLFKIAVTVLSTFLVCWLPFLRFKEMVLQVLHRVFPLARGLYEVHVHQKHWCYNRENKMIFSIMFIFFQKIFGECKIVHMNILFSCLLKKNNDILRTRLLMYGVVCQSSSSWNRCLQWISWFWYGKI